MNRRVEVAHAYKVLLEAYGIPVVADPLEAVIPPCVILGPGSPYRSRETTCWAQTVEAILVGQRLDDLTVYDHLDDLADTFTKLKVEGVVVRGADGTPTVRPVGDVDHLAVSFTLTVYNLGAGLSEAP